MSNYRNINSYNHNAIYQYCTRFLMLLRKQYYTNGIKEEIPFYMDVKRYNYQYTWYDTKQPVSYRSLKERGILQRIGIE